MKDYIEVPSIHDDDLLKILTYFNKVESIQQGNEYCENCSRLITFENIGAIFAEKGKILLFCDLSECINSASKWRK